MASSIILRLKVYLFRFLARLLAYPDYSYFEPIPPKHAFEASFSTTSRPTSGNVKLLFYTPPAYKRGSSTKHPLVLNFHGGGYTIGLAQDDCRWAAYVTSQLNAVFVSVKYGLAPENPYPVAIGDGVDAMQFLWSHADDYNLDVDRTIVTGFSAGGTLTLATLLKLYDERKGYGKASRGRVEGIVLFYPGLDWTQTRAQRTASNPISAVKGSIPRMLYDIFDNSYLGPEGRRPDPSSPYLSPGRADAELLQNGLPNRIALYVCEWDQLLVESHKFRVRLEGLGKVVGGYLVREVPHGFDKKAAFERTNPKRKAMYEDAIGEMEKMLTE